MTNRYLDNDARFTSAQLTSRGGATSWWGLSTFVSNAPDAWRASAVWGTIRREDLAAGYVLSAKLAQERWRLAMPGLV